MLEYAKHAVLIIKLSRTRQNRRHERMERLLGKLILQLIEHSPYSVEAVARKR